MRRVLITGAGSYVGSFVKRRLEREPARFYVEELDIRDDIWRSFDFSEFDSVFHVAGIAHVRETPDMAPIYFSVNRDLAVEVGERAKAAGVGQFIFMSTAAVYGSGGLSVEGITSATPTAPDTAYGRSKLEAEEGLRALEDDGFGVAVLRCPMVYGPGCPGNFARLAKIAKVTPVFPRVANKRSVLYVENLAEFVTQVISRGLSGVFWPQNAEYMSTDRAVQLIGEVVGHRVCITSLLAPAAYVAARLFRSGEKAFGSFYYGDTGFIGFDYRLYGFAESIERTFSATGVL